MVGDAFSDPIPVVSGVHQGSSLGPTLFIFFVNLIDLSTSGCLLKFADDCKLFRRISKHPLCTNMDVQDMQLDLDALWNWSNVWAMEFSVEKCAVLHFGRTNPCQEYYLGGQHLEDKRSMRDLGVMISSNLKSSVHCAEAVRRAEQVVYCLRRIICNKNVPIIRNLYISLVRPILEYCCTVWCPHYARDIALIERVQRRVTRMVPGFSALSYDQRLRRFGIQSLETRRSRADLILLFKICHDMSELKVEDLFDLVPPGCLQGHQFRPATEVYPQLELCTLLLLIPSSGYLEQASE